MYAAGMKKKILARFFFFLFRSRVYFNASSINRHPVYDDKHNAYTLLSFQLINFDIYLYTNSI